MARKLASMEKDEGLNLAAEVNGKVVANSTLNKRKGISSHTGEIGIIVMKGYRNIGIGTEMLKTLISQAKKMGLKMLYLGVFSTNKLAYHVYEKVGFKETGRRPKFFYKKRKVHRRSGNDQRNFLKNYQEIIEEASVEIEVGYRDGGSWDNT